MGAWGSASADGGSPKGLIRLLFILSPERKDEIGWQKEVVSE